MGIGPAAQGGTPAGDRAMGALKAGGITFIAVATLGITIGSFLDV